MRHIIILVKDFGFPNGMASTQYVRLLSQSLIEQGLDVTVLCLRISEFPPQVENTQTKGKWRGVNFEYTTGVTSRSKHFIIRRWVELRGMLVAIFRLIQLKANKQVDIIYSEFGQIKASSYHFIFTLLANLLHVPITLALQELTWKGNENTPIPFRWISPLIGMQGGIAISDFLYDWAETEIHQSKQSFNLIKIPILVDVYEQQYRPYPTGDPVLVYAASSYYYQVIPFLLNAMEIVWKEHPNCGLVITGYSSIDYRKKLIERELINRNILDRVNLPGYISRQALLDNYSLAHALLIPLPDNDRSRSRFPTKIGEYLASSRPIITSAVGEVKNYLTHCENGMLSKPDDEEGYAESIEYILQDAVRANEIGQKGRLIAEQYFHYEKYSKITKDFFYAAIKSYHSALNEN